MEEGDVTSPIQKDLPGLKKVLPSWSNVADRPLESAESVQEAARSMEHDLSTGLSLWAIVAIVCNSVVGVLILILFVILCKACKVPSHQGKLLVFVERLEQKETEQKYTLTAA